MIPEKVANGKIKKVSKKEYDEYIQGMSHLIDTTPRPISKADNNFIFPQPKSQEPTLSEPKKSTEKKEPQPQSQEPTELLKNKPYKSDWAWSCDLLPDKYIHTMFKGTYDMQLYHVQKGSNIKTDMSRLINGYGMFIWDRNKVVNDKNYFWDLITSPGKLYLTPFFIK